MTLEYGHPEILTIALAREIQANNIAFHGLASPLPMTAMKLAKALGKEFTILNLTGGVDPDYNNPAISSSTLSANQYEGTVAHFGLDEIFDLAGAGKLDIAFLSFVQLDYQGHINMSHIGGTINKPKVRLPGGAGTAMLTPVTKHTTIWKTKHDTRSFVAEVDFITTTGNPHMASFRVLTPLAIFELNRETAEMDLVAIMPGSSFAEVQANTGWEIKQTDAPQLAPPTEEELRLLQVIDPNNIRAAEF